MGKERMEKSFYSIAGYTKAIISMLVNKQMSKTSLAAVPTKSESPSSIPAGSSMMDLPTGTLALNHKK